MGAVGATRVVEMVISHRRRRALAGQGARPVAEPRFGAMVLLHAGVLVAAGAEAVISERAPAPAVAFSMLVVVLAANALRWWVIVTLGPHWNVKVMGSLGLGVVTNGPYRWIRHPNYVAVFLELTALPLVHAAYLTAALGAMAHVWVLFHRIRLEETVLLADPNYRALMGGKPRFLPLGPPANRRAS